MKKQFKALIVIAVIALLCAAAVGCAGGSDNAAVGKWNLKSVDLMGATMSADELGEANPDLANTSVEFKSDGTYTLVFGGDNGSGGYKIDGNTITLDESGVSISGELNGDSLVLDLTPILGIDAVMTFTKA